MDTLISMRTFRSVAELGSFVAASERLALSPAMTSKHVMHLEAKLGARLLNRTSRKVSLTEAGAAYLVQLSQTLDALDEAEASISQSTTTPKGLLRLSAPVWAASGVFASTLADFCQQYPDVDLEIDLSGRLVDVVDEGYDLVLRVSDSPGDQFIARPIATVCFYWVAAPTYIAQHPPVKHIEDLAKHSLLWYQGLPRDLKSLSRRLKPLVSADNTGKSKMPRGSIPITPKLISANETLLREAALQGMGIAALPHWMISEDIKLGRLQRVIDDDFPLKLQALYHSRKYLSSKVRTFLDFLVEDGRLNAESQTFS
jgi:DNA-binding transcriptional LysR family regulator